MIKLYDADVSGNAYKGRLFLSLLGRDYERVPVNLAEEENQREAFLALNPRGQIPVLVDGETVVWDSQAILVYLARAYGQPHWLPVDPLPMAQVMQWMAVAENEALFGLARARAVKVFGRPWNFEECQSYGRKGLNLLNDHLASREWLATDQITIADIAVYPYVALSRAAELPLDDFSNTLVWMQRIEQYPGYVSMPGIEPS